MSVRSLRKCGRLLLLGFLLAALAAPRALAEGSQLTIAETRTDSFPKITVRLTATDSGGGPIGSLEARDFVVEENGRAVESLVVYPLRQSKTPLAVVLAVDVSGSMAGQPLDKARAAAKTFVSELRSIDRVALLSFSTTVSTVVPFTNDRSALARGLDGLVAKGDTALYDATDRAVAEVTRVEGSRVVVVLTDGEDTISKAKLSQALELAAQTRVPIFTIGLGQGVKDDVLSRMAQQTSGRYYKAPAPDDLAYAFRLLSRQIANQYELYYFSPLAPKPGGKVDVVVRLARGGTSDFQARFSYLMPLVKQQQPSAPVDPGQLRPVVETPRPQPPPAPSPLPPYWAEIAALSAGAGVLAVFAGLTLRLIQDVTEARLTAFVESAARPLARRRVAEAGGRLLIPLMRWLAGLVIRFLPGRQIQETRRFLVLAGNPHGWGVEEFLGVRALLGIALGAAAYLLFQTRGALTAVVVAVAVGILGFLLPVIWLRMRIRARQKQIFRAMPNALDLLSVSVEAGLGFDQAVAEVCRKWHNPLTQEFAILLGELQMGRTRREALRGLMERTGVPELGGFASALIQADELGASIARTLAIQAEQIRIRRRQRAEQEAHEASVKMLFPLVFLMFPSLFIVILGPAVPSIMEAFRNVGR